MNILVSACLLGVKCRYNGKGEKEPWVEKLGEKHRLIPVCPEKLGGFPTPCPPAEIVEGRVVTRDGENVTPAYEKGAEAALRLARRYGCTLAVLKEKSPSCGSGQIYDGTFTGRMAKGEGICTRLLREHGIKVYGESQADKL